MKEINISWRANDSLSIAQGSDEYKEIKMQEFSIQFDISGTIVQHLEIKDKYSHLLTQENLNNGNILTSVSTSGDVVYIGEGQCIVIGHVVNQDPSEDGTNEYSDFSVIEGE